MTRYRTGWWLAVIPLCAIGFLAGLLVADLAALVVLFLLAAGVGALTVLVMPAETATPRRGVLVRSVVRRSLTTGTAAATFASLSFLGLFVWPIVAVIAITSPPAVRWMLRRVLGATPELLSDYELCCAWRASTIALRRVATHQRLTLAGRRQDYLDEMERRNGDGFRAWLDAGLCADEQLERFLVSGGIDE